jgi:hypothetical protein
MRIAKAILTVVLIGQGVFAVNACMLPSPGVSMAYTDAEMPACEGILTKNACLMESDQVPGSEATALVFYDDAVSATPAPAVRLSNQLCAAIRVSTPPSAAPPPRILFCRLLN